MLSAQCGRKQMGHLSSGTGRTARPQAVAARSRTGVSVGVSLDVRAGRGVRRGAACRAEEEPERASSSSEDEAPQKGSVWRVPSADADGDWRKFRRTAEQHSHCRHCTQPHSALAKPHNQRRCRAQLVANEGASTSAPAPQSSDTWAHLLPGPEQSCVLIANPALFSNQQRYFNKSVILMVSHGGASEGSMGIILNKPTGHTVKEADGVSGYVHGYANHKCEDRPLHMGGDVGGCMLMLHSVDVPSAHKVLPGLYVGGHDEVEARLLDGRAAPEDTAWYLQYAGWGEGQLAEECRRRVWYPVSCSTNLLTQAVEGDGTHVWHTIMELVNDDFRRVSEQARQDAGSQNSP